MRYLFAFTMLAFACIQLRAVIRNEMRWRKEKAAYLEQARIADLPDDEFIAWCKENGRA